MASPSSLIVCNLWTRSSSAAFAGSRHSCPVADLLGRAFIGARENRWTLGRVYREGFATLPSGARPTTVRTDRCGLAAGTTKDFTGVHELYVERRGSALGPRGSLRPGGNGEAEKSFIS